MHAMHRFVRFLEGAKFVFNSPYCIFYFFYFLGFLFLQVQAFFCASNPHRALLPSFYTSVLLSIMIHELKNNFYVHASRSCGMSLCLVCRVWCCLIRRPSHSTLAYGTRQAPSSSVVR